MVGTNKRQMDQRERARANHQEWRDSMTSGQHQAYLARRRALARGKRPAVESMTDNVRVGILSNNRDEPAQGIFDC